MMTSHRFRDRAYSVRDEIAKAPAQDRLNLALDALDEAPAERLKLPDYVPQVAAGVPAPVKLTDWMIQAIRMCILVERIKKVSRKHFQHLKLHQSRWSEGRWLIKAEERGLWKAGPNFPAANFRRTHPVSYAQIEADWPIWGAALVSISGTQGALSL